MQRNPPRTELSEAGKTERNIYTYIKIQNYLNKYRITAPSQLDPAAGRSATCMAESMKSTHEHTELHTLTDWHDPRHPTIGSLFYCLHSYI